MSLLDRPATARPAFVADLAAHGDRLALATHDGTLTYAELAGQVAAVAERLGAARRLVLVAGANQADALVAYLGALAGGHPVALVPGDRASHVEGLVAHLDPDVVVGPGTGWALQERRDGAAHELHPDLALLLGTSGSTGSPRLVRLSHRNLESNAAAIAGFLGLTAADRAVTSLPIHYCYGLSVVHSHLAAGAGLLLTDRSVVDRCFWDLFRDHGGTSLAGVPHTFDLLDRVGFAEMDLPTLRYVTQAGGRLDPDHVRRLAALGARRGWELFVMYGQTEATARMAYLPPHLAGRRPAAIGVPIPGGAFELAPVEGTEDPEVGELVYRGDNVMLGYADGPADLALGASVRELRTGDLARRHADGLFEIVGRRSRFAKVFGLRLDLDHLEGLLGAASITAWCASDDHRLVAAVTQPHHAGPARDVLVAASGLPPSRVEVTAVDELPRLPSGKPDRAALLRLAGVAERDLPALDAGAATTVHPEVRRRFAEVLHRGDLDGEDTFVDLGGDSLSYVEMSIALEEVLGELPPDWHTTPLGQLQPRHRAPARVRRTETTVVLRALSIVLVVGTHIKLFDVLGGAHLLLAVGGYNFGRFGQRSRDVARSIARIAVPSMVWLAIATTLNPRIDLTHVLLVNGWFGTDGNHGGYWYVEAILQILVPLALLLGIPAVRRIEQAHRFGFALGLLAAGLAVRFHVIDVPTVEPHDIRAHDIVWIFALGWAAAQARSRLDRALLSAVAVAAVPGYFGEPAREALVAAGLLLLVWVPTLPLWRPLVRPLGAVAAASLYTYLTHWQVFPPLLERFGPVVALAGSILAGVVAWEAVRHASAWAPRAVRWGRRRVGQEAPTRDGSSLERDAAPVAVAPSRA